MGSWKINKLLGFYAPMIRDTYWNKRSIVYWRFGHCPNLFWQLPLWILFSLNLTSTYKPGEMVAISYFYLKYLSIWPTLFKMFFFFFLFFYFSNIPNEESTLIKPRNYYFLLLLYVYMRNIWLLQRDSFLKQSCLLWKVYKRTE